MREEYVTGTGQVLKVHRKEWCVGDHCAIHNPSDHHMKDWPTHWRADRQIFERICKCGVGHPDPDSLVQVNRKFNINDTGVHGCCGCCEDPGSSNIEC